MGRPRTSTKMKSQFRQQRRGILNRFLSSHPTVQSLGGGQQLRYNLNFDFNHNRAYNQVGHGKKNIFFLFYIRPRCQRWQQAMGVTEEWVSKVLWSYTIVLRSPSVISWVITNQAISAWRRCVFNWSFNLMCSRYSYVSTNRTPPGNSWVRLPLYAIIKTIYLHIYNGSTYLYVC